MVIFVFYIIFNSVDQTKWHYSEEKENSAEKNKPG
jgi:hypothetical protein